MTLQLSRARRGLARAEEAMAARMTMFWMEGMMSVVWFESCAIECAGSFG